MKVFNIFKPKSRIIISKGDYHNGVARVQCKDGLFNYVDAKGHFLFKTGFHKAEEFTSPCAIADNQLLKYDGRVLFQGNTERLKDMESLFVVYKHSFHDDRCALVSSDGQQLTGFDYSRIHVDRNGVIIGSFTRKEYSPISYNRVIEETHLWWCKLGADGKELMPRMSYDKEWVNDSLCTCRIYNWNDFVPCSCLYDTKNNVIVQTSIRYLEETKQYRIVEFVPSESRFFHKEEESRKKAKIVDLTFNEILPAQFDEVFPSTRPHHRHLLSHERPKGPFNQTNHYIVKANDNYGLYDTRGNCLLEPRYSDIQSSNDTVFLIDSDKGILVYDVAEDRQVRSLIEHIIDPLTIKTPNVYYRRKYDLYKSEDGTFFFTLFRDPESGKLGIVDDRLRVLLPPEYDDIDSNFLGKTFSAILPTRTETYTQAQLIQKWEESKLTLQINRFAKEVTEEDINRRALDGGYNTVLFVDTETNGLPKDYYAPINKTDNWPRILQISWVISDSEGEILKRRKYYVRPEGFKPLFKALNPYAIPEEILNKEGVGIKEALEEFSRDISTVDVVVGHNIQFDKSVIQAELTRAALPDAFEGKRCYCTMIGAKTLLKIVGKHGFKYPKLNELYRFLFHEDFEGAHDASNDVDATIKCFFRLAKPGTKTLSDQRP